MIPTELAEMVIVARVAVTTWSDNELRLLSDALWKLGDVVLREQRRREANDGWVG